MNDIKENNLNGTFVNDNNVTQPTADATTQAEQQEPDKVYSDASRYFHFTTDYSDTTSKEYRNFVLHIFCTSGHARLKMGAKRFDLYANSCAVILNNQILGWPDLSSDFRFKAVFISNDYLMGNSPDTNYDSMGMLSLMEDPVVKMTPEEFGLCISVTEAIKERLTMHSHMFYASVLRKAVETLLLDIYNIHARTANFQRGVGNQGLKIFHQFISMLEHGTYRENREVQWYSSQMNISAKYLSEVCLIISGHSAGHWINRFTIEEIARLLHNPKLHINRISEMLHFTTNSYFSHYVKKQLGQSPRDYRSSVLGNKRQPQQ